MNIQSILDDIETSQPYKEWRSTFDQTVFLVSVFSTIEDEKPINWHINYYIPGIEKATTFTTHPSVAMLPESELSGPEPKRLNAEEATLPFPEIIDIATEGLSTNYPNKEYSKMLVTLHQLEKATWNITFLTPNQPIVFQVDANSGEIVSHKAISLTDLGISKA